MRSPRLKNLKNSREKSLRGYCRSPRYIPERESAIKRRERKKKSSKIPKTLIRRKYKNFIKVMQLSNSCRSRKRKLKKTTVTNLQISGTRLQPSISVGSISSVVYLGSFKKIPQLIVIEDDDEEPQTNLEN